VRRVLIIAILIVAVGSGGVAGVLIYRILKTRSIASVVPIHKPATTFPLIVTAVRLPYGTVLQAENVKNIKKD